MNHATTTNGTPAISGRAPGAHPAQIATIEATEADAIGLLQMAFNALATASWHVARGEATQALSRIKRAQAHLAHSMESRAV